MKINTLIDLDLTQLSGQTSQPPWICKDGVYSDVVLVEDKPCIFSLKNSGDGIDFNYKCDVSKDSALKRLNYIYDLDFDLNKFYKYLLGYDELKDMPSFCNGLRLFKAKDPFECIVSSITSANNSIARWTKSMSDLKNKWGENYKNFHLFPTVQRVQDAFLDKENEISCTGSDNNNNLKAFGLGYRAPYIKKASQILNVEIDICDIFDMNYDEAFKTVISLPGVGPKVADCILLYGFNFKQAFPSDVWIKRIVSHLFFEGRDISIDKVRSFGMEEFGDYAGYVQLYLFHYARKSGLMPKLSPGRRRS